jgi:glycosyltransferase involved in cell wall biosynthesis
MSEVKELRDMTGQSSRPVVVLLPVYNDQQGLRVSLANLPGEIPLDVIVVDDGSDPPTFLPDVPIPHRAVLMRLQRREGIAGALNRGIKWILRGGWRYVSRLDAGDIALPGRFAKQVAFLDAHPEFGLVGGQARFIGPDGRKLFSSGLPTDDARIRRRMHVQNCFIHPAVTVRSEVFYDVGLYDGKFWSAEDYEIFFRVMRKWKVANLGEEVLLYRIDPGGITGYSVSKRLRMIAGTIKVQLRYFDPSISESYLGLLRSLFLVAVPKGLAVELKSFLSRP